MNILVSWDDGSSTGPQLSRLLPDGSQDVSFTGQSNLPANVIKVQSDGMVLVGGPFPGGIARLDNTGSFDPAFIADVDGEVFDIAVQPDGKIIVVGFFDYFNGVPARGIARLNKVDGSLDNTFNTMGISDALALEHYLARINIQADGKIIVGGNFDTMNGSARKNLVRLNVDGTVDCFFDPGLSADNVIPSMTLDAAESIFIAGAFTAYDGAVRNGLAKVQTNSPPVITITLQPADRSVCEGGTATFNTAATGTTNITYQWQFSLDTSPLAFSDISNGANYSGATTATLSVITTALIGAGRYRCRINGDLAAQVLTNDEGLFVNSLPASPTVTDGSTCPGATATLMASGAVNGKYRWYNVPSGGVAIAGEVNGTYITPPVASVTNFYVSIVNASCESTRSLVVANMLTVPSPPSTIGATACGPSAQLALRATGGPNGQYRWYSTPSGGVPIAGAVNGTYVTPSITTTTSYYVAINDGICESARMVVTGALIVCSPPAITSTFATTYIEGIVSIDLTKLISDAENNVDPSSLKIVKQPASGAKASLAGFMLSIDYKGIPYIATETVGIQVCDLTTLCSTQDISILFAGDIVVYNAVSPNSDGKNDFFLLEYIELIPSKRENKVSIFDRWGAEVYSTSNYNNADRRFNGLTADGSKLPPGTYFYKISFSEGSLTGFLELRY